MIRASVRDGVEQRRLASDGRAGRWARAEAARREAEFLRRTWKPLLILLAIAAAGIVGVAFLTPAGFLRGLVVGVLGTAVVAMVAVMTLQASGSAFARMGATAEQWTASELRPLRRAGWRLINHYLLGLEIDHLLIGPGGVIVVETKWHRTAWRTDAPDRYLLDALEQVKRAARQVELWTEIRKAGCPVRPVLFSWSAEVGEQSPDPNQSSSAA